MDIIRILFAQQLPKWVVFYEKLLLKLKNLVIAKSKIFITNLNNCHLT